MNEFMKVADDLANDNVVTNVGGPFGACIVMDNKIIGKGSNHVVANNDPTAHAEIMAIKDACKNINSYDLSGAILYTNCYPCPMCLSAIIWANIKEVYYGNTSIDAQNIGFRDDMIYDYFNNPDNELIKLYQINRDETIKSFKQFAKENDMEMY